MYLRIIHYRRYPEYVTNKTKDIHLKYMLSFTDVILSIKNL